MASASRSELPAPHPLTLRWQHKVWEPYSSLSHFPGVLKFSPWVLAQVSCWGGDLQSAPSTPTEPFLICIGTAEDTCTPQWVSLSCTPNHHWCTQSSVSLQAIPRTNRLVSIFSRSHCHWLDWRQGNIFCMVFPNPKYRGKKKDIILYITC